MLGLGVGCVAIFELTSTRITFTHVVPCPRAVYWIQMISNGVVFLLCLAFFEEPCVLFSSAPPHFDAVFFDASSRRLPLDIFLSSPYLLALTPVYHSRADVILGKRCKRLEAETGVAHYIEGSERFEGWGQALAISVKRPLQYLFTEPIVTALSLYAGLAWGASFLLFPPSRLCSPLALFVQAPSSCS